MTKCPNAPDPRNMAIDATAAIFANNKHIEHFSISMIDKHVFLNYSFHLFLFFFFFLLHVLLYKILSNNFIYVTKMFHTRWKSCVFFIFTTIKREQVYRTRVARKLVARGPTSWNHWTRLANLTRGGKIIPVLDSQDPTNLDSFPARVLVRTTWSRAKTPLWTLDKT